MVADGQGAAALAAAVRGVLTRDDDYAAPGKPPCDWDDPAAREALVDALVRDSRRCWACCTAGSCPRRDHPAAPGGRLEIFGDSAYADAGTLDKLGTAGHTVFAKVPPIRNSRGLFGKDRFGIDLAAQTVTCPAAHTVPITPARAGG